MSYRAGDSIRQEQWSRRGTSRDTKGVQAEREVSARQYKDYVSYTSEVENSSSSSDLPAKGVKRSSKITSLQQQFQDLKKKIKDVQNKNERIIQKINFSKDVQRRRDDQDHPQNLSGYLSKQGSHSEIIPSNSKARWPQVPPPQRKPQTSSFYQSQVELKSTGELRTPGIPTGSKRGNESMDVGVSNLDSREKNRMKLDIQALEDKYRKQQSKLQYVKNNFKSYSDCVKLILENQLGQFMDNLETMVSTIDSKNNRNKEKLGRLQIKLEAPVNIKRRNSKMSSSFDIGRKKRDRSEVASEAGKTKNKEFEVLISKYEQILRTKNDQIQKLSQQIHLKDRQLLQTSDKLDEMREQRRKMGHDHDDMVAKLQNKIQTLNQPRPTERPVRKEVINLASSRDKLKQQGSQKFTKQIKILESKLSFTEARLQEKVKTIQQLQLQIKNVNQNKTSLLSEYQETFQKTRVTHKAKYEELTRNIEGLNGTLRTKDQTIVKLTSLNKDIQNKYMQLQVDFTNLNQKLVLRENIQKIDRSAQKKLSEVEQSVQPNTHWVVQTHPVNQQVLEKEKRQLQFSYDKLKNQYEIYKLSNQNQKVSEESLRQKDAIIRDLKSKLQKSILDNVESPGLKRKETNLLETSVISTNAVDDMRSRLRDSESQILKLKSANQQLKTQNITVSSRLVGLGHDVTFGQELTKQHQDKTKELKQYVEELEKMVGELQKIIQDKTKQLQAEKEAHSKQLATIENDLKVMEDEFATINSELIRETDKVNIKVMEVRKLQEEIQDWKLQAMKLSEENQNLQLRLDDIGDQMRKQGVVDNRINEDYKAEIANLKSQIQTLSLQNTKLTEAHKHQKSKIQELELQVFMDAQNQEDSISSQSEVKAQNLLTKMKMLQQVNLEADISKANLQRHLKNSEENNTKLMQELNDLIGQLDKKKSEYNAALMGYDEKIQELELNLESAQKALREKGGFQHHSNLVVQPNDRVFKSELRSQSSFMISNTSQLYGDKQIDFKLSDDGGSEVGDTDVQAIFNNVNYPYQKIKLRRKDQVEFISKTAQYINKLKGIINDKNRRIKSLEKKVTPQKLDLPLRQSQSQNSGTFEEFHIDDFDENYSVRFDDKKNDRHRKMKQLENETVLVMEQNNLLLQQVSNLQDELERAEQQENNLMRMKEILKEEINKLRKTSDEKEVMHQSQILKLQKAIQENVAVHNSETMRILLPKILNIACNQDYMRKDQKRRELQEYIKIIATILRIEPVPVRYQSRR